MTFIECSIAIGGQYGLLYWAITCYNTELAFFFQKLQCTMSLIHFYISLINTPPSLVTGMTEKKPEDQSIFSVCFYMYMYIKCLSFYT